MTSRFDYVVVGAGVAGCVVAGRLAAHSRTVLLIEAGPSGAPRTVGAASFFDAVDEPDRIRAGVVAHPTASAGPRPYLLGQGLGGGSAINAMIATPGRPDDFDRWERDFGCAGWGWSSLKWTLDAQRVGLSQSERGEWGSVDRALAESDERAVAAWLTRRDGVRATAADAYLPLGGDNLHVRTDTRVARVVLDDRRATGVLTADGEVIECGEVVVCAGAIETPAMLLRSGVERAGIGQGLKDHPSARLRLTLREPNPPSGLAAATLLTWSSTTGTDDLQILPLNHLSRHDDPNEAGMVAAAMTVESEGSVTLAHDLDGPPTVRLNLLGSATDRRVLREAVRHMFSLATAPAFREIVQSVEHIDRLDDDTSLDAWIAQRVGDTYHASCTCRMGPFSDETAVVDTAGLVHGYQALRVCDSSIFPDISRANPMLPMVMVAEQIAAIMVASG